MSEDTIKASSTRRQRSIHALAMLAVCILGAAIYAPSLDGPFVYDDRLNIVANPALRDPSGSLADRIGAILRSGQQETRPLTLLSFALCFELAPASAGNDAAPAAFVFRLLNLLLHLGVALLVYALALVVQRDLTTAPPWRGGGPFWLPLGSAALFVSHPLATEGVAYINSRSGLLATFFGLLALLLYLRFDHRRQRGLPASGSLAASLLALLLALLSKESAAVTPLLAGAYVWLMRASPGQRSPTDPRRSAIGRLSPLASHLLLCVAVIAALFALVRYPHGGTFGTSLFDWGSYAITQLRVLAIALLLLVYPLQLNFDYDFRLSTTPWDPELAAAAILVGGWLLLGWLLRRRAPPLTLAVAFFFVGLAPTNSLVQFRDLLAERHLYLPLCGFCIAVAWGFARWRAYLARTVARTLGRTSGGARGESRGGAREAPRLAALAPALLAAFIGTFALLASARARVLADPVALWADATRKSPDKPRPWLNLGIALLERDRPDAGYLALLRAERLAPDRHDTQYNLGVYFERRGELQRAVQRYRRAIRLRPRRRYRRSLARTATRVGVRRFHRGDLEAAAHAFEEAGRADPQSAAARFNLALTRAQQGRRQDAVRLLRQTLRLRPDHAKARRWLERLARD